MANFPGIYRSPYAGNIASLLSRQGDIAAEGARQSGAIWGNAVSQLGQIAGGAVEQHQAKKDQKQREAMFDQALASYDPTNPREFYRSASVAFGPEFATQTLRALTAAEEQKARMTKGEQADPKLFAEKMSWMQRMEEQAPGWIQKNWTGVHSVVKDDAKALYNVDVSPEYQDEYGQMIRAWAPPEKPIEVSPGASLVDPSTMKPTYTAPLPPPKPEAAPKPGSFEAFVAANPGQDVLQLRARWEAAGRKPEGSDKSKIWVVRDGQPLRISEDEYQPGDQPTGARERPVTGAERRVLSFYMRAQEASDNVEALEDKVKASGAFEQARRQWAPNILQSTDDQLYRQAQRAFTEARLRKDSGATIKKDEYESDAKTYFAQPGDSDKVLEQKRRGRAKVLESLRAESGRAYPEYFGGEEADRPVGKGVTVKSITRVD